MSTAATITTDDAQPAVLFTHELQEALAQARTSGTGCALLHDVVESPDCIHLRLGLEHSALISERAPMLPLHWWIGDLPKDALAEGGARIEHAGEHDRAFLFIAADGSDSQAVMALAYRGREATLPVTLVQTGAAAFSRNTPILESDILRTKRVLCLGLGSGGSAVVNGLARAGVGGFILWDNDRLEAHNIGRHACTLRDIGRLKVNAVRDLVMDINPGASVETAAEDINRQAREGGLLERLVAAADLVIVATDNNRSRFAINSACWRLNKPAYYGRAFTRACGGDVIQVVPSLHMPCYACHVQQRVVEEEVSNVRQARAVAYADQPVPVEPGLNVDVEPIANLISRLALARLASGKAAALTALGDELDAPIYLWANRREHQFANWRPMGRGYERMSILRWYGITVKQNPDCMVCGASEISEDGPLHTSV